MKLTDEPAHRLAIPEQARAALDGLHRRKVVLVKHCHVVNHGATGARAKGLPWICRRDKHQIDLTGACHQAGDRPGKRSLAGPAKAVRSAGRRALPGTGVGLS
jgi:hypothetical protein